MKKLLIAVCAATLSGALCAATCSWGSGTIKGATSTAGGWSTVNLTAAQVTMSVYLIDETTFDGLSGKTQKELYDTYSTKTASFSGSAAAGTTAGTFKPVVNLTEDPSTAGTEWAVVIATYTDATYGDMYIATAVQSVWNGATSKGTAGSIISNAGSRATDGGWQAVPEPTSGLLLLLGVAGLALRRRHA